MRDLIDFLGEHVTEKRLATFHKVLNDRTRYLTVMLEDIYQPHNASAVLRSCDCFGIQDVHIVENTNKFKVSPDVALGSSKWLNINRYDTQENNTAEAIKLLKDKGYRIVATTPHTNDVLLDDFDISKGKAVLVFGTELTGISDIVNEMADEFVRIPMYGFTESYNISVSVALVLHHLTNKMRLMSMNWQLSEDEKDELEYQWLKRTVKSATLIEAEFHKKRINK